jgi:hypothetical protein
MKVEESTSQRRSSPTSSGGLQLARSGANPEVLEYLASNRVVLIYDFLNEVVSLYDKLKSISGRGTPPSTTIQALGSRP